MKIDRITAREILDSRGNPTVAAAVFLTDGVMAEASVPSGASTGKSEALELRDGGARFNGQGVLKAVGYINGLINSELKGQDAKEQAKIDQLLCDLDGTDDKGRLGSNAILAVSMAVAKAQALSDDLELFEYLAVKYRGSFGKKYKMPVPMFNVLNGGKHAGNNVDIQEAMVVPFGLKSFDRMLRAGSEIYHTLRSFLVTDGYETGLGDEGGFSPNLKNNEEIFKFLEKAILEAGYKDKVKISIDVAADSLYSPKSNTYILEGDQKDLDSVRFGHLLALWAQKYHLLSIEDGLHEEDKRWAEFTKAISPTLSIGDDLFTTHAERISQGAKNKLANGVIIKLNQVGTVSETLRAIKVAQKKGFKVIVSHRSGETEESFIADLAVAVGADYIKAGAPARSERLAKYNRLLKIEEMINSK